MENKLLQIVGMIFCHFLMLYEIFFSQQEKQSMVNGNKLE